MAKQALLLRVGVDSASGRAHGPLFADGRFEYVPIPESTDEPTAESDTYADLKGRTGGALAAHVTHLAPRTPHHDPEFLTHTYGDPSRLKRSQLSGLDPGDLLVFYGGLQPSGHESRGANSPRLYAIGYLTVASTRDLEAMADDEREEFVESHPHNAHCKRLRAAPYRRSDHFPVVVFGDPTKSGLFTRPRPLAREDQYPLAAVERLTGVGGSLTRAGVARRLDGDRFESIRDWLDRGAAAFVTEETTLRVRVSDGTGDIVSAGGYCAVTNEPPTGRPRVDDWALEISRAGGDARLSALCHVDEVPTAEEFRTAGRFAPLSTAVEGRAAAADGGGPVPVGSLFWHLRDGGVALPAELRETLDAGGIESGAVGERAIEDRAVVESLITWLSRQLRPGVHGATP